MKRQDAKLVGDIINEAFDRAGVADTVNLQQASYLWTDVVGPVVNHATTRRYIEGETLHVYIASAPLKSELSFMTDTIVKRINEALGKPVLESIVIH